MNRKLICLLLLIVCIAPALSGCGSVGAKRELSSLAIVLGMAIDKPDGSEDVEFENFGEDSEKLLLTTQVVRTLATSQNSTGSESSGSGSGSGGEGDLGNTYWNVKTVGGNILETLRSAIHITNRRLYIAHNQVVIISKEVAEDGIAEYLDYFFRDHETRYDVDLIISDGRAEDVLDVGSHLESFPAEDLKKLIEKQRDGGFAPFCSLFSFMSDYKIPNKSALIPYVKIVEPENDEISPYLYVAGSAVFKRDKMVTALKEKETRGALWLLGEVKSGVIALKYKDTNVSLEIMEGSGDFKASYKDGRIKVKGDISVTCVLGEYQGTDSITSETMEELRKECAAEIEKEVRSAFDAVRKEQADIYGVAEYFYRYQPKIWDEISDDFEELYKDAELELSVDAELIRTGSLLEPADVNGGGSDD